MSKNWLLTLLPYFLFAQGIFVFYKIIPMLLTYYQPEAIFLFPWGSAAVGGILAILAGIGILMKKRWGINFVFDFCYISNIGDISSLASCWYCCES